MDVDVGEGKDAGAAKAEMKSRMCFFFFLHNKL